MRINKNRCLMMLLALVMLISIPSFVMADSNLELSYTQAGSAITVNIMGSRNRPVSISIKDESRYYYIDQGFTDDSGSASFKTSLSKRQTYDCRVNIDGNIADKKIIMKDSSDSGTDPEPEEKNIANLYIKGYKGVILDQSNIEINPGESALSFTTRLLDAANIDYVVSGGYISMINGQKEFDKGKDSGWMSLVNGRHPNVGANTVKIRNEDSIEWVYTYDLGEDVGAPSGGGAGGGNKIIDNTIVGPTIQVIEANSNRDQRKIVLIELLKGKVDSFNTTIPAELLKTSMDKKIDYVKIISEFISFEISPDFMGKGNIEDIHISVQKLSDIISIEFKKGNRRLDKLERPIKVILPYNPAVLKKENLTVELINDDGLKENLGGIYDEETKTIMFLTNKLGKFVVTEKSLSFNDLSNYGWADKTINMMASKGFISGRSAEKFDPSAKVTRAEFSVLIARVLRLNEDLEKTILFKDVTKGSWYFNAVRAMYENDLVSGKSETSFDPQGDITREEMTAIIGRVLENNLYKKQNTSNLSQFSDRENISKWAEENAAMAVHNKLIVGTDGQFMPKQNATRAEAAVILYRLYELIMD